MNCYRKTEDQPRLGGERDYDSEEWMRRFDSQDREFAIWHARRQYETLTWAVLGLASLPLIWFIMCLIMGAGELTR